MAVEQSSQGSFTDYAKRLSNLLLDYEWNNVDLLAQHMREVWKNGGQVFFCGNGGSAGNAIHLANDFVYGVAKKTGGGIKAISLSANSAVMTCLANDVGYDHIFSEQLAVQGSPGDILIALSGSGNSQNIINTILQAEKMKIKSYAILGFNGGRCKDIADISIHFPIDDMQISEDMQLIVGHMIMQKLYIK